MYKYSFVLVLSIFVSCDCIYQVKINKDGSAHIDQKVILLYEEDILKKDSSLVNEAKTIGSEPEGTSTVAIESIQHFMDSPIIHNYEWSSTKEIFLDAHYDIDQIDSLGNYIDGYYKFVFPSFTFSEREFKLICPPGNENAVIDEGHFGAILIEMIFKFPYKIESASGNSDILQYTVSNKKLHLKCKLKDLYYAKSDTELLVMFE